MCMVYGCPACAAKQELEASARAAAEAEAKALGECSLGSGVMLDECFSPFN